ncbi:MAG: Hsp70 family protein [Desulfobacterales bacterium]
MSDPVYIVGIDFGTTNSVVAYAPLVQTETENPEIRVFAVPQLVDMGVVERREQLPSFIYLSDDHQTQGGDLDLPWAKGAGQHVGLFARERGAEVQQRLIQSAKSWLCNPRVDRHEAILPWDAPQEVRPMSPVAACAAILSHLREAWNHTQAHTPEGPQPHLFLENQEILLTVPASFDPAARELTVQAAQQAGLPQLTLLEEPQAALYAWIAGSDGTWRETLREGDLVLVCDVGGGTSDFSLIAVGSQGGSLQLERIAVGSHLLVGGDNMDLTLAYAVAAQLARKSTRLDAWQMRQLSHACRGAKEQFYAGDSASELPLTILGRGSKLIGGTLTTHLQRATADQLILDGFFPHCERDAVPQRLPQTGIQEFGLAYESDPAVTRHLAQFLTRQSDLGEAGGGPSALLFNGGVMKADIFRRRVLDVVGGWSQRPLREIVSKDRDLAVAKGAAYYGLARRGKGIRIRSGLAKSYYIGVAAAMPAVPGIPMPTKALCVAPYGMEEGSRAAVEGRIFNLLVGETVQFDFYESAQRSEDAVGQVVEDYRDELTPATQLETVLEGEGGQAVPVTLEVRITEVGTLEIWCLARDDQRRWRLEFNVREQKA